MNLVRRNSLFHRDPFFDDFWNPALREEPNSAFFAPRVDINEQDTQFVITAELPGVKKEDIHIHVEDGILTLEAESTQDEKEEKGGKVIRQERRYGKYVRRFNVGGTVHEDDITASFNDGILTLTAPKAKEPEPKQRRIEIS